MSFILDALRKSENERQRNQQPGVAPLQTPLRKGSGLWLPLVALLVGVNLSLLLVMWIMGNNDSDVPAATQGAAPSAPAIQPAQRQPFPAPEAAPTPAPAAPAMPDSVARAPAPAEPAYTAPAIETPVASESNLPTMEELVLNNSITLDPLRLDIHVYSDNPAERFVFINMNRYNEGQTLTEGPMLITIDPSGVVLRHQGYDFLMTRE